MNFRCTAPEILALSSLPRIEVRTQRRPLSRDVQDAQPRITLAASAADLVA